MAVFNPDIPKVNPQDYLNYSRPISDIPADKSTATMIEGIGDAISQGLQIGDKLIKDKIQADIYSAVDPLRDQMAADLEDQRQLLLKGSGTTDPTAGVDPANPETGTSRATEFSSRSRTPSGTDVIPTPQPRPPEALKANLDKAETIAASQRNNQGNLSMTYYDAQLTQIAKQMRSQWPSYTAYIDQQMSSITGKNPANALISSQMADINRLVNQANTTKNSVLSLLQRNLGMDPKVPQYIEGFTNGTIPAQKVYDYVNSINYIDTAYKRANAQFSYDKNNRENAALKAGDLMSLDASREVSADFVNSNRITGEDSPQTVADIIQRANAGQLDMTDEQAQAYGPMVQGMKDRMFAKLWRKYNQIHTDADGNKYTLAQAYGTPDQLKQFINNQLVLYDNVKESLINKDVGRAFAHQRAAAAIDADDKHQLYGGSYGEYARMLKQLESIGGQAAVQQYINNDVKKFKGLNTYASSTRLTALTQPNADKGNVYTIAEAIEKARERKVADARVFRDMVDISEVIKDPKSTVALKTNAFKFLFDSKNKDLLDNFAKDSYDAKGNFIPGKYAVFNTLTDPDVAQNVVKLAATDRTILDQYNSAVTTHARKLFGREARDLSNLIPDANTLNRFRVGYNVETNQFEMPTIPDISTRTDMGEGTKGLYYNTRNAVDNINKMLTGVNAVSKSQGRDATAAALGILQQVGFNAGDTHEKPVIDTLTDGIKRAYTASKGFVDQYNKTGQEATSKARTKAQAENPNPIRTPTMPGSTPPVQTLNFAEEQQNDLGSWIRNPAGVIGAPIKAQSAPAADKYAIGPGEIISTDVRDIPEGMSPEEYLRKLRGR